MDAGESYMDGLCRMLRSMVGKTTVSTQRRTVESEWTLTVTIGDAPPWMRSDNWMLPIHAADAIERLRGELFPIRKELEEVRAELESKTDELNRLREMRDRWIAGAQLHATRANQSPPEIRSHSDSADA